MQARTLKLIYIGNRLSQKGRTVTSIETLGSYLENEGFQVIKASHFSNKIVRLLHMLWTVFKHRSTCDYVLIDTYSTQNFWFAVAVANVCRLFHLPYIPILRGGDLPARLEKSKFQSQKLFHGAKFNVAPSKFLLHVFQNKGYQNLVYIPNTIQIKDYHFKVRKPIMPALLWVRSFATIYNPLLALQVLENLLIDYPEATLCMIGPDKDGSLQECKTYSEERNLPVSFTGKLSKKDWIDLSVNYDIFINTTNFDNTPVSVIEAMALGLPVISTNVGGIPYLLDDSKDSLLVPPNNTQIFVEKVKWLINEPLFAEQISLEARKKVIQFDWEKIKHAWNSLLQD